MTSTSPLKRRNISYRGYEMIVEDAERVAAGEYETVGNWSFAEILDHLAKAFASSIDGLDSRMPWPVRIVGGFLLKGRMLNKTLPSGFKIPGDDRTKVAPEEDISVEEALETLRKACHRCKTEKQRSFHPLFGNMGSVDWDRFNLRHAELHMSFVVPTHEEPAGQSARTETTHAT